MRDQHGLDVRHGAQAFAHLVRVRGIAPFGVELRHVGAIDPGDLGESVAEGADAHPEHAIARRQRVDDGRLEPTRASGREHDAVRRRAEERLHPLDDAAEHRRELGSAVVDHLAGARFTDRCRQGRRAGDAEVGLETVHGRLLGCWGSGLGPGERRRLGGRLAGDGATNGGVRLGRRRGGGCRTAVFGRLADTCARRRRRIGTSSTVLKRVPSPE